MTEQRISPPKRVCAYRGNLLSSVTEIDRMISGFGNILGIHFFSLSISQVFFSFPLRRPPEVSRPKFFQDQIICHGKIWSSLCLLCQQKSQGSSWLEYLDHVPCCQPITGAVDCNVPTDVGLGHVLHPRAEGGAHSDPVDWKWGAAREGQWGSMAKKWKNVHYATTVLPCVKIIMWLCLRYNKPFISSS